MPGCTGSIFDDCRANAAAEAVPSAESEVSKPKVSPKEDPDKIRGEVFKRMFPDVPQSLLSKSPRKKTRYRFALRRAIPCAILSNSFRSRGRRGGRSKSAAKLAAVRANLKKAQAARRKYPPCPRYKNRSHRFSPATGRCPCGYSKPASGN